MTSDADPLSVNTESSYSELIPDQCDAYVSKQFIHKMECTSLPVLSQLALSLDSLLMT